MADYFVDYSRDKRGRLNEAAKFTTVAFPTDGLYTEDDWNELQWVLYLASVDHIRNVMSSNFVVTNINKLSSYAPTDYSVATGMAPVFKLANMVMGVDGFVATLGNRMLADRVLEDGVNKIQLGTAPSTVQRDDLIYAEVWVEEKDYNDTLYKFGVEDGETISNTIGDPRYIATEETSRRSQIRTRILVKDGVTFNTSTNKYGLLDPNIYVKGGNTTFTTYKFSSLNSNDSNCSVFVYGTGSDVDESNLKSMIGKVYAVPLFKITRKVSSNISLSDIVDLRPRIRNYVNLVQDVDILYSEVDIQQDLIMLKRKLRIGGLV
jgi:hypothetical protein